MEGESIHFYPRAPGNASRAAKRRFHLPQLAISLPRDAQRATVEMSRSQVVLTGWAPTQGPDSSEDLSLQEYIQVRVHKDARWAVERFTSTDDGATIADAIQQGKGIGVSDGLFKDKFGTAYWIL
jgi:hypothetical protein